MDDQFDSSQYTFLYFAISILFLVLAPLTYNVLKYPISTFILQNYKRDKKYKYIRRDSIGLKKIAVDLKERKYQWVTSFYFFKFFLWLILVLVLYNSFQQLPDPELMRGFDPHDVLGVSQSASINEIKKAYRKKALEHHPDKNYQADDKQFIKITKAYECLQDPRKFANCQKYGNPDGYSGFQISIALPSFILKNKENQLLYLFIILGGFLFTVVGVVFTVFTQIGKYDKNGIQTANMKIIQEFYRKKKIKDFDQSIELIGNLVEFEDFNDTKKKQTQQIYVKTLMNAYLNDTQLNETDKKNLFRILKIAPISLISTAEYGLKCIDKLRQNPQMNAPFTLKELSKQIKQCLLAQQNIIQGITQDQDKNIIFSYNFKYQFEAFDPELKIEELTSTDLYILKVFIEYKSQKIYVQSEKYPYIKENNWYLLVMHNDQIIQYRRFQDNVENDKILVIQGQMRLIPFTLSGNFNQTTYKLKLILISDSYLGQINEYDVLLETKPSQNSDNVNDNDNDDSEEQSGNDDCQDIQIPDNKRQKNKVKQD